MKLAFLLAVVSLFVCPLNAQTVQIPYQGSAPYSGSVPVQVSVTGLPSGCSVGTPTYAAGTIAVPVNCGVVPPPVGTNCASASVPVTGCTIGSTVAVVNNPGNVRGAPAVGGGNGPLMGTQPGGAKGVIMSNPTPQSTAGKGWQVVNFGAPNSCNPLGPYGPNCGYLGNDNLAPSGVTPPPITTCAKTVSPSGGVDNAALLAALAAVGPNGCVEMLPGTTAYNFTPFSNITGSIIVDDGVTILDSGIFSRTTPLFSLGSDGFSMVGKGPLFNATLSMPTNYANALKEVAEGNDYEYQHCYSLVNGVSRVTLSGFKIFKCGGDGVDMDDTTEAININLDSSGNIRQGISCTGAVNGVILAGWAHDGPLTGFDCEPDSGISGNIQIAVQGLKTSGNKGGGRSYGFMNLTPATKVNVVDNNPVSTNDTGIGIAFWNRNSGTNANATGSVTVNGFNIIGATSNCTGGAKSTDGFKVIFNGGTCTNSGQAALMVKVDGGETGTPGGVSWNGITITGTAPALSLGNAAQTTVSNSTYNGKAVSYP